MNRSAFLPDAPTLKEGGVDFSSSALDGYAGAEGVPRDIVNEMAQAVNEILKDPTVAKKLFDAQIPAAPSSPEAVDALVRAELEKWRPVIKKYNITVNDGASPALVAIWRMKALPAQRATPNIIVRSISRRSVATIRRRPENMKRRFSLCRRDEIRAIQDRRFVAQIARAWEIPFYQRHWEKPG